MQEHSITLDSVRQQEQQYETQIRSTYQQYPNLFITHSSDTLNLKVVEEKEQKKLIAKTHFNKYDIVLEIRGSVIKIDKLRQLLSQKVVSLDNLPTLLLLSAENKYLLSPKNISRYMFKKQRQGQKQQGNCYIENHWEHKLFVIASRDIEEGQKLSFDQKTYQNVVFKPQKFQL